MTAEIKHIRSQSQIIFCKDFRTCHNRIERPDELVNKVRNEMIFTLRNPRNFCPLSQCIFIHVRMKQIFEINIVMMLHVPAV